MRKVILSLSGGMDSATLLGKCVAEGNEIETVGFTYGSKHNRYENKAALLLAEHYRVPFTLLDLSTITCHFKSVLLLGQGDIPEGHYEKASMSQTVVPSRNMIFLSILTLLAESWGCEHVWIGVHAGDHHIYPDCRPAF